MTKDVALEHGMNIVSESNRNKHTVDIYTPHESDEKCVLFKDHITKSFDVFDKNIVGDMWGFVKEHLYSDKTPMIHINGISIIQGLIRDEVCEEINNSKRMMDLRYNVWYEANNKDRHTCWVNDGEPELLHILKGGHTNPIMYFVVHESAFDPIGHKTELLTSEQINDKYGIKL